MTLRRLYLFRHGLAVEHGTPGYEDDERPLTPKGERQVARVGRAFRRLEPKLDAIVTSPLPRAARTAEIAAAAMSMVDRVEFADVLRPGSSPAAIAEWLEGREEDRLALVGHNPNLSGLLRLLVLGSPDGPALELRKGGLAAITPREGGGHDLDWLTRPRLIRRLCR